MNNRLTFLGTSSATPTRVRFHSGQYLVIGRDHILLDCGEGTQNRMLEFGINFQKIRYIFISHLHGDHILGLPGLLNTMSLNGRQKELFIYGPSGLKEILQMHFSSGSAYLTYEIHYNELKAGQKIELESLVCNVFEALHRIPCFSFKIEELRHTLKLNVGVCEKLGIDISQYSKIKEVADGIDKSGRVIPNQELTIPIEPTGSYAYVTDTLFLSELAMKMAPVSVLYHEATYLSSLIDRAEKTFHSTAEQAAEFAKLCGANRLILGHFSARYDDLEEHLREAKGIFADTILAVEGQTIQLF